MLNIEQTQQAPLPPEILKAFDTNKVAKRGTLQRLKVRRVEGVEEGLGVETVMEASEREEAETDKDGKRLFVIFNIVFTHFFYF